jgi:hypothetical protein
VDTLDDPAEKGYAAWPDRLYVIDAEGKVALKGKPGPSGFKPAVQKAPEVLDQLLKAAPAGRADDRSWVVLCDGTHLDAWRKPTADWATTESVAVSAKDPKKLEGKPGTGVIYNGPQGKTRDLVSTQYFGDAEVHVEFLIPKGSNSGVKLHGHYEIQIYDSYGKKTLKGDDCGGIYPRAEMQPTYHHIDDGIPPKVNAAKPAGEWQTLDIVFQAPRFDAAGARTAKAKFVKVELNGTLIHENVEMDSPTGHAWHNKELATGPLLLQADHGPVAFRNVKVRPVR